MTGRTCAPSPAEIAAEIEGTDAAAVLLGFPFRSFCNGSDALERLGLWNHDGETTDAGREVAAILRQRWPGPWPTGAGP